MKVVQILPELDSGGVERGTLELGKFLVEQGHESVVISNGGKMVSELELAGSRHVRLPVHKKSPLSLRAIPPLRRFLKQERPDILHLRSRVPAWLAWMSYQTLSVEQRPRLVSTVHGFYSINAYSRIMTCGERVICVSEAIRDYVVKNYQNVPGERLDVIQRGIEPSEYYVGYEPGEVWREKWYAEFPQTRGRRWIVLPGRLSQLKGQPEFIELFARILRQVPNAHALIVGGAHPRKLSYAEELRQQVADLGLGDHLSFTGQRSDLREILSCASLVLSLSRQPESFGRTVLEPLALGIPVIGFSDGGVGEILRVMLPEGIVSRADDDALLERSLNFLKRPPTPRVQHPFLLETMLTRTLALYHSLLESPRTNI